MRKWIALSGLAVIAVLVAIQFVPVTTANPPVESDIPTSPEVKVVLRRACYDCHSHETVWPWYSHIAPISWIIVRDVQEGRAEVNFSLWNRYGTQQQVKKLKESWEEIAEGEMPPWFYPSIQGAQSLQGRRSLVSGKVIRVAVARSLNNRNHPGGAGMGAAR